MTTELFQRSFAGGEISPSISARGDMVKYASGARKLLNFIVQRSGGVTNRPGTKFLGEKKWISDNDNIRIEPFTYIATGGVKSSYMLEFGHNTMRVWADDGWANTGSSVSISSVSRGSTTTITTPTPHGFVNGDIVGITGVVGMWELNGRDYVVGNKTEFTFEVNDMQGAAINSTLWNAFSSGGSITKCYVLATTITSTLIPGFQIYPDQNKAYIVHGDMAPLELVCTGANSWAISAISFGSATTVPTSLATTGPPHPGTAAHLYNSYKVTAVDETTLEESDASSAVNVGNTASNTTRVAKQCDGAESFLNTFRMNISVEVNATVTITSASDNSGLTFTIYGQDTSGNPVEEAVTGPNATTVTSSNTFWYVNNVIHTGGALTGTVDIGKTGGDDDFVVDGASSVTYGAGDSYIGDTPWNDANMGVTESSSGVSSTYSRKIELRCFDDERTYKWTFSGTNSAGDLIQEELEGVNVGTVQTTNYFRTITGIHVSATAWAGSVDVGWGEPEEFPVSLTWTSVSGALEYRIYRANKSGIYGLIGTSSTNSFLDDGLTIDYTTPPVTKPSLFSSSDNYPSAVAVIQQRLLLGNTNNNPVVTHCSRIGNVKNFGYHRPQSDADAIEFSVVQKRYGEIMHYIDLNVPVMLTATSERVINGNEYGALTPGSISTASLGTYGSSDVPPVDVGGNAIFVQAGKKIIRDLAANMEGSGYRGGDLTVFASHLFKNRTVERLAYQSTPHSVVWAMMSDGALIGMTYLPEHQIWGWHRHDFQGDTVVDIASMKEGDEDFLYVVLSRTLADGTTRKYVERITTRDQQDEADLIFLDSALSYDGHTATTMTLSGGVTWASGELITGTAGAGVFDHEDKDDQIHIEGGDGTVYRFEIVAVTSSSVLVLRPLQFVPAEIRSTAILATKWGIAVDEVGNLWHLEGESVSIYGDRAVFASPNNPDYTAVTVSDGKATLGGFAVKVHVGLPIVSDFKNVPIQNAGGRTIRDKPKVINRISLLLEESRGYWAGQKEPSLSSALTNLLEQKARDDEDSYTTARSHTGIRQLGIDGDWGYEGDVFIRHVDPTPLTILGIIPSVDVTMGGQS